MVSSDAAGSMGRPNAPRVEAVAARILNECLIQDGSLLTPGVAIWTSELLAELHTHYVAAPDVSAKSFGDKLEIQLAGVSDHARQLFAELYVLNLLPVSERNFLQKTKIANVERVLAPIQPPSHPSGGRSRRVLRRCLQRRARMDEPPLGAVVLPGGVRRALQAAGSGHPQRCAHRPGAVAAPRYGVPGTQRARAAPKPCCICSSLASSYRSSARTIAGC